MFPPPPPPPCKAYEDFTKDVSWFNRSNTVAVVDVSLVMSADNERTISELSRFLVVFFCLCCFVWGGGGGGAGGGGEIGTKFCKGETKLQLRKLTNKIDVNDEHRMN